MKTTVFAFILLFGFSATYAADKAPSRVTSKLSQVARVLMLENNGGVIRLGCEVQDVKIVVFDKAGKVLTEGTFFSKEISIDVSRWEEGDYDYSIIRDNEVIKTGTIKVVN